MNTIWALGRLDELSLNGSSTRVYLKHRQAIPKAKMRLQHEEKGPQRIPNDQRTC